MFFWNDDIVPLTVQRNYVVILGLCLLITLNRQRDYVVILFRIQKMDASHQKTLDDLEDDADIFDRRQKRTFANAEEKRKGLLDNTNIYKQKINTELKQMVDFLSKRGYPIPSRSQPKIIHAMFDALKKTCAENDRLSTASKPVSFEDEIIMKIDLEKEKNENKELRKKLNSVMNVLNRVECVSSTSKLSTINNWGRYNRPFGLKHMSHQDGGEVSPSSHDKDRIQITLVSQQKNHTTHDDNERPKKKPRNSVIENE